MFFLARLNLWAFVALFLTHCASYTEETSKIRGDYRYGHYQQALDKLEASDLRNQSRNRLLYRMEKGMIMDRLGMRKESRSLFLEADKIADELFTVSVSKAAASLVVNDSMQDYDGELYEKIGLHTILALSFLQDGLTQQAQIEARKINAKLEELTKDLGTSNNGYREDGFARYLSGLIYESKGNWDDAIIDYQKALDIYSSSEYSRFYVGNTPSEIAISLARIAKLRGRTPLLDQLKSKGLVQDPLPEVPKDSAQIVVIHEVGQIAAKEQFQFVLAIGNQVVRFSFPIIPDYATRLTGAASIQVDGEPSIQGTNTANMSAIAHFALDDRKGRMLLKNTARLVAKAVLVDQANQNLGPLAGLAANVYTAVTETADTRGWTLFPGAFFVSKAFVKPGKHRIEIRSGYGVKTKEVEVQKGQVLILRDIEGVTPVT